MMRSYKHTLRMRAIGMLPTPSNATCVCEGWFRVVLDLPRS